MKEDTAILPFRQSERIDDPLTEFAPEGVRRMLAEALVAKAGAFTRFRSSLCQGFVAENATQN